MRWRHKIGLAVEKDSSSGDIVAGDVPGAGKTGFIFQLLTFNRGQNYGTRKTDANGNMMLQSFVSKILIKQNGMKILS